MEQQLQIEQLVERSNKEIQVILSDDEEQGAYEQAMQSENSSSPLQDRGTQKRVSVSPPDIFYPWHTPVGRPFVSDELQYNQLSHSEVSNAAEIALDNHHMEQVLPHPSTSGPVDNCKRSDDASQVKEYQDSFIDSVNKSITPRKQSTTFHCAECGKQYSSKAYLVIHSRNHTGEKLYKCSQCDYATTDKNSLFRHKSIHSHARPFKCLICNDAFKQKRTLDNHQKMHKHSDVKMYKCLICGTTSKYKQNIRHHQRTQHDDAFKSAMPQSKDS